MSRRRSCLLFLPLLAAGCSLSRPEEDWSLDVVNRSDRNIVVRLGYREPDAGRAERIFLVHSGNYIQIGVVDETWERLVRRVGSLTIDFCDEEKRESFEQRVVAESDLKSSDWTVFYPRP